MKSSGFVKVIRSPAAAAAVGTLQTVANIVQRAAADEDDIVDEDDEPQKTNDSAGLSVQAVVIIIGSILALWLLVVTIGVLCKYLNKPRSAAHVGGYLSAEHMYQPSAAGYGDRPSQASNPSTPDPKRMYNSRATLIDGASPMGRTSLADVSNVSTPDVSTASILPRDRDYFAVAGPSNTSPAGRLPGQHHRHASSGVGLPGPTSAVRRGASGQHPPTLQSASVGPSFSESIHAPDGGSFRPGQYINCATPNMNGMSTPQVGNRTPRAGVGVERSNSKVLRGPPPARSNSKRKSRYSQMPRVESVGAGLARESRFIDDGQGWEDGQYAEPSHYSRPNRSSMAPSSSRRSVFAGGERSRSVYGAGRMSIYGAGVTEEDVVRAAQAEGFGSGTPVVAPTIPVFNSGTHPDFDPLGARPAPGGRFMAGPSSQQAAPQMRGPVRSPQPRLAGPSRPYGDHTTNSRAPYMNPAAAVPGPFGSQSIPHRQPQLAGGPASSAGGRQLL